MNTLQTGILALRVSTLFIFCLICGLMVVSPTWADVGVQPILPGGSNIQPEDETPIQMAAEIVVMNVRPATEADNSVVRLNPGAYGYQSQSVWYQAIAEVQVDFTMKNPTMDTVSMTVWFPLASALKTWGWEDFSPEEVVPRIENFMLSIEGNPVDYKVTELPNPNGADMPLLPWASFPLTFPADKETMIHISYVLPLTQPAKTNALVLYYVFQTGAGWAGPIGQAELILNLPYPASTETLSGMPHDSLNPPYFLYSGDEITGIPPGAVLEGNQARWIWKDWEPGPDDDFAILLMHPGVWDGLQADRAAVKNTPGDGQAWWKLCHTYYGLSRSYPAAIHPSYSQTYQAMGIDTCQRAADLLQGDAAPHYVLAWFYLSALSKDPTLETLKPVLVELKIAQALEAVQSPSQVVLCPVPWDLNNSECIEQNIANIFPSTPDPTWYTRIMEDIANQVGIQVNHATATGEWTTTSAGSEATSLLQPSTTTAPTQEPTITPLSIPSRTPQPPAEVLPVTPTKPTGFGQSLVIIVTAGVIGLIIVCYFGSKRIRKVK